MNLAGKVAIISGGSAGIGLATARKLGLDGSTVAICGRSPDRLAEVAVELRGQGIRVHTGVCDVCDVAQVEAFVSGVVSSFGKIDVLVNNAGALGESSVEEADDRLWAHVITTNLNGTYYLTSRSIPHMVAGGRIVNISGVLGRLGAPGWSAYCTSKHGLIGFTRSLALELASRKITVNAICPGWVETELAESVMKRAAGRSGSSYEEVRAGSLGRVPLGEMIEPDEVAELIRFLASGSGRNITGQAYTICGGQVMQ